MNVEPSAEPVRIIDITADMPDVLESSVPPGRPRRTRTLVAAGATLLLVLGIAVAYRVLSSQDRRPEDLLPASVIAFAGIDLDVSLDQQLKLLKLADKLPRDAGGGSTDPTGVTER